ncbi:MAG: hypothetical protein WC378_01060 [Opitutaceae bacterium]|jgi:hypothetical protein
MPTVSAHLPDDWSFKTNFSEKINESYRGKPGPYLRELIERDLAGTPGKTHPLSDTLLEDISSVLNPYLLPSLQAVIPEKKKMAQPLIMNLLLHMFVKYLETGGTIEAFGNAEILGTSRMGLPNILAEWSNAWDLQALRHELNPADSNALASAERMRDDLKKLYKFSCTLESFKGEKSDKKSRKPTPVTGIEAVRQAQEIADANIRQDNNKECKSG